MSELKPCPFCQLEFEVVETEFKDYMVKHDVDCPMWSDGENGKVYFSVEDLIAEYNARPLEDALRAENARLRAALSIAGNYLKIMDFEDEKIVRAALKGGE